MKIIDRVCCFIVGWNYNILKESGEASRKTLKRYMAAIIILSIIWGTIGWCIAADHLQVVDPWGKAAVAAVFILIVICIERFIILSVGGLGMAKLFRIALALLMATLGSTIFDQIIFRQDVLVKMKEVRTEQINREVPKRLSIIDADIVRTSLRLDSIGKVYDELYEVIAKRPTIPSYDIVEVEEKGVDAFGNPTVGTKKTVVKKDVRNPLLDKVSNMEISARACEDDLRKLQEKRLSVESEVREEYDMMKSGFLEELETLYSILLTTPVALGFYIFLFLFLSFLEMLVVTTRSGNKCDYELIVEHQLNVKGKRLKETEDRL